MNPIITLTMNSSVDLHYNVARMESVKKLRASEPLIFPGGGGINVSRVIKELGAHSIAVFTADDRPANSCARRGITSHCRPGWC